MGIFTMSPRDYEECRDNILNSELPRLSDLGLIQVALARLMEANGVDDPPLIKELYRRGAK